MSLLFDKDSNNEELILACFAYIEAINDWIGDLAKKMSDKWGEFAYINKNMLRGIFESGIDPELPEVFKDIIDELGLNE